MACLVVIGSPSHGVKCLLRGRSIAVLGRDSTCDLVVAKSSVSRQHAQVLVTNGRYFIEDAGSTNGTFVNGRQIQQRTPLKDGDRINLFDVSVAFHMRDDVVPEEPTQKIPAEVRKKPETDSEILLTASRADVVSLKQRLASLVEITSHLGSTLKADEILPRILDLLFVMFSQAKSGEIHLLNSDGRLVPVAMKHGREADSTNLDEAPRHAELTDAVIRSGVGKLQTDVPDEDNSVLEDLYESTMCAPIVDPSGSTLGVILLETDSESRMFRPPDLELTALVGVMAGQSLAYSRTYTLMMEHERHQRTLASARAVQISTLPRRRPTAPGYAFSDYYATAEVVGGDFYFYETMPDGRVVLGIADVAGKGLSAAMHVVRFAGDLRLKLATCGTLKTALDQLNRLVDIDQHQVFITCCVCVLDPVRHQLTVANAGHMPPLCRRRESEQIETFLNPQGSLPLGIAPTTNFHPLVFPLHPGDQVFLYTDGVTEAMNPDQKLYGEDRLISTLAAGPQLIDDSVKSLVADVQRFRDGCRASDDTCIVGLQRLE